MDVRIDLHGKTHKEAEDIVSSTLNRFLYESVMICFVTGHSQKMRDIVTRQTDALGLRSSDLRETEIVTWTWGRK